MFTFNLSVGSLLSRYCQQITGVSSTQNRLELSAIGRPTYFLFHFFWQQQQKLLPVINYVSNLDYAFFEPCISSVKTGISIGLGNTCDAPASRKVFWSSSNVLPVTPINNPL